MRFTVEPSGAGGGDLVDLRDGSEVLVRGTSTPALREGTERGCISSI
jgi:hypothetical protein